MSEKITGKTIMTKKEFKKMVNELDFEFNREIRTKQMMEEFWEWSKGAMDIENIDAGLMKQSVLFVALSNEL